MTPKEQNDKIRTSCEFGPGQPSPLVVTPGVMDLGEDIVAAAYFECATFIGFTKEDDPYDRHDFGVMTIEGHEIWFKIDDTENPEVKTFTFLLPEEN